MSDDEIGKGTTTLDYLKVRYQWLGELIDKTDSELERLRAENLTLKVDLARRVSGYTDADVIADLRELVKFREKEIVKLVEALFPEREKLET